MVLLQFLGFPIMPSLTRTWVRNQARGLLIPSQHTDTALCETQLQPQLSPKQGPDRSLRFSKQVEGHKATQQEIPATVTTVLQKHTFDFAEKRSYEKNLLFLRKK